MTDQVDAARERMARAILDDWTPEDLDALVRLLRRFADGLAADPAPGL